MFLFAHTSNVRRVLFGISTIVSKCVCVCVCVCTHAHIWGWKRPTLIPPRRGCYSCQWKAEGAGYSFKYTGVWVLVTHWSEHWQLMSISSSCLHSTEQAPSCTLTSLSGCSTNTVASCWATVHWKGTSCMGHTDPLVWWWCVCGHLDNCSTGPITALFIGSQNHFVGVLAVLMLAGEMLVLTTTGWVSPQPSLTHPL